MLERVGARFETIVVGTMQVLLMIVITFAVLELIWLLYSGITARIAAVRDVPALQEAVQRAFAGVLLVLLGLEVRETLKVYSTEHRLRLELILIVALIAASRHIIQLDFEHVDGVWLVGAGTLFLSLGGCYYLIKKSLSLEK